jgi:putative oxidoreductase
MKNSKFIIIALAALILTSCVQKSNKKTIIVKLNVEGIKDIHTVGIRGKEKPLSWKYDMELKPIIKDTLYVVTFSLVTGYKFTEVKFTVNGQFELNEKDNRKIMFNDSDTTVYEAKFDILKKYTATNTLSYVRVEEENFIRYGTLFSILFFE